jgi:hypothetical protein
MSSENILGKLNTPEDRARGEGAFSRAFQKARTFARNLGQQRTISGGKKYKKSKKSRKSKKSKKTKKSRK